MIPQVQNNALLAALLLQCTAALLLGAVWARQRRRRRRRFGVHPINRRRNVAGHFNNLYMEIREDAQMFYRYTRMTLDQFDTLLELVAPHMPRRSHIRHKPMPTEMRLVITLRYLATGDEIMTLATDYRIGETTCRHFIKETCDAIWSSLQPIYLAPPTKEDFQHIADEFWNRWNIPHCLGSIDGKHIVIRAPPNTGSHFFCYKGTFSLVLMAVCDARYCFTLVDIGHAGSVSDGGVFRSCEFGKHIINNTFDVPDPSPLPGTEGAEATPSHFFL